MTALKTIVFLAEWARDELQQSAFPHITTLIWPWMPCCRAQQNWFSYLSGLWPFWEDWQLGCGKCGRASVSRSEPDFSHRHSITVTFQWLRRLVSRANETDLQVSISTLTATELPAFPKTLLLQLCLGFNICWALYKLRARHNKMWEMKRLKLQLLPPDLFNKGAEPWGR